MRRLPGILLLTGAALVVIAALLVSGLRIALPHLDAWRPEILNKIESATGMPVEASQLSASWQNFGPTLEAHDIRAELKDGGEFSVKRVTLASTPCGRPGKPLQPYRTARRDAGAYGFAR